MNTIIPHTDGNILKTVRSFLGQLFKNQVVELLFLPLESENKSVLPVLVKDVDYLEFANPLAPVMAINAARSVSSLTNKHSPARLGVVLRNCEIRALLELVKLQQASLENVIIIAFDCLGTFTPHQYRETWCTEGSPEERLAELLGIASQGMSTQGNGNKFIREIRSACQMCVQPIPEQADIHFHLFGANLTSGLPVTIKDHIAAQLQLSQTQDTHWESMVGNPKVAEKWIASHAQSRADELTGIRSKMAAPDKFDRLFADCIGCHNCMTACPICYCKTCLFNTPVFDHQPSHYLDAVKHKGALRLPSDTLLFHLTRLNHMSASCVSCGMCSAACPEEIPVGTIFSAIGERVQAAFGYSPGRDVAEPLPLITFRADEWSDLGE